MDLENQIVELKEELESIKNILSECVSLLHESDMCNENLLYVAKTFLNEEVIDNFTEEELDFEFLDYWESVDTYFDCGY